MTQDLVQPTTSTLSRRSFLIGAAASGGLIAGPADAAVKSFHVVVYGGTSSGVIAAYAAARENLKVALIIGPNPIGGMTANGLSKGDIPDPRLIGGLTRTFFSKVGRHYRRSFAVHFEPHVTERIFREMLTECGATVFAQDIRETAGIVMDGTKIKAVRLEDGTIIAGRMFIDASYEGDLMAMAGVPYDVGRDGRSAFGESMAGFGVVPIHRATKVRLPNGKLLPGVREYPNLAVGARDRGVMGYNYRLTLTDDPADRVPFAKPPGYDPDRYLLDIARRFGAFHPGGRLDTAPHKIDRNNDEQNGLNWGYPDGSRATRRAITQSQIRYQAGRLYFLANDPRVPQRYRDGVQPYGLCKSEYPDNGHWPRQLYVRETRRMRGLYKMRQQNAVSPLRFNDAAFEFKYSLDSHMVQFLCGPDDNLILEGGFSTAAPSVKVWQMPLRALLPQPAHCTNLVVTACASVTRVFNTSYRMEAAYMMAGEAAAVLCATAIDERVPSLQALDLTAISQRLKQLGARFSLQGPILGQDHSAAGD